MQCKWIWMGEDLAGYCTAGQGTGKMDGLSGSIHRISAWEPVDLSGSRNKTRARATSRGICA